MSIYQEMADNQRLANEFAICTIIAAQGSTPRDIGSKMLIYPDGRISGTIGGGTIEKKAIAHALECLSNKKNICCDIEIADSNGAACGGKITAFIEICCSKPSLIICGAGHVGGAVMRIAKMLDFHITLIDTRVEQSIREKIAFADNFIAADNFGAALKNHKTQEGAFIVIATFGHAFDEQSLEAALSKQAAYVGMIGSREKIAGIFERLKTKGIVGLEKVHTPIGLDIGAKTPEEIAIAIVAEILMVKNGGTGRPIYKQ